MCRSIHSLHRSSGGRAVTCIECKRCSMRQAFGNNTLKKLLLVCENPVQGCEFGSSKILLCKILTIVGFCSVSETCVWSFAGILNLAIRGRRSTLDFLLSFGRKR